jgi:hypothetical protein
VGFDLVAQDEIGSGVAALGLVELVAERDDRPGAVSGSISIFPISQFK